MHSNGRRLVNVGPCEETTKIWLDRIRVRRTPIRRPRLLDARARVIVLGETSRSLRTAGFYAPDAQCSNTEISSGAFFWA
jgi:hypothetical protein